jgi:FAD/FMN-containing dehydrogenase
VAPIGSSLLRAQDERELAGCLLEPGGPAYEQARRVWNGAIDRRPALIARCSSVAQVAAAVRMARRRGLEIAVRGGGHGVSGHAVCDGGFVIDLGGLLTMAVDPHARIAHASGGVLWGELDRCTQRHGLAVTGGIVSHTGIAGLTLGGGIGWLMRRCASSADNLLAAEVVTSDGMVIEADERDHPELLWALRGGGGNFGVVTRFDYRLHPIGPQVLAGPLVHRLEDAGDVMRFYREFVRDAPDELTTIVTLRRAPALPFLPETAHGSPVLTVAACYAGPIAEGQRVLGPLRGHGQPLADAITPRPYVELQAMNDATVPHGWHYYWRARELAVLTDDAIDALVAAAQRLTSPRSYCILFHLGGALSRVAPEHAAFDRRAVVHEVNVNAVWLAGDPDHDRHVRWTHETVAALEPATTGGVYLNFLDREPAAHVRRAFRPKTYERLVAVKRLYDPGNTFHNNHNIVP